MIARYTWRNERSILSTDADDHAGRSRVLPKHGHSLFRPDHEVRIFHHVEGKMEQVTGQCPNCGRQDRQVKAGLSRGAQRYKCSHCGKRYLLGSRPHAYGEDLRQQACQMRANGMPIREIARDLNISAQTVSKWCSKSSEVIEVIPKPEAPVKLRATIIDVAKRAGVSTSTVSNYLNDKGRMSPETRRRVGDAMKALYFTPSAHVQAMRRRRTHTIGLLTNGIYDMDENPGFTLTPLLMAPINRAADRAGYDVLVYTGWPHRSRTRTGSDFLNGQIDGLLWVSPEPNIGQLRFAVSGGLPVMALLTSSVPTGVGFVVADNIGGVREMVLYLAGQGHRRIAFLGSTGPSDFMERATGYRTGLSTAGIEYMPDLEAIISERDWLGPVCEPSDRTEELAPAPYWPHSIMGGILDGWLALSEPPTVIIAIDDGLALNVVQWMNARGLRVPYDIAVCGFNDIPAAKQIGGGLTTVRQPFADIGRIAVERLEALINGAPLTECRITVPVSIVRRASTDREL